MQDQLIKNNQTIEKLEKQNKQYVKAQFAKKKTKAELRNDQHVITNFKQRTLLIERNKSLQSSLGESLSRQLDAYQLPSLEEAISQRFSPRS